ncbi:DUF7768 domain-containing protein [Mycobacteroides abscessus]|uniref:DUF7768 domain-containing protein n=1 Tax=Mycobacteroides abscessus TaxID=36809 RepID=UPI00092A1349|nr:hypothetical protein [Mycobacteroides abscessus]SIM78652.1 Uncharacterised protein [Mycobacteroides abscessus subsp. abscessus]
MDKVNARPLVYPAQSKLAFFCREAVCEFVLRNDAVPLHPFMIFGYFLSDRVDRDIVRSANNTVVSRVDEVWVFGDTVADGVFAEIDLANRLRTPVRFFTISTRANEIVEIDASELKFEDELIKNTGCEPSELLEVVLGAKSLSELG